MNNIKLISHRGNLDGRMPKKENHPKYIIDAIQSGYDCEIDLRVNEHDKLFLGHDEKQYEIDKDFLLEYRNELWVHCKDRNSLNKMVSDDEFKSVMNYFYHENDDYTLTSRGHVWAYPNRHSTDNCVMVILDENTIRLITEYDLDFVKDPFGICTDWVARI